MPAPSAGSAKTTFAITILVLGSLLSSSRMIFKTSRAEHFDPHRIAARSDDRFALLKRRLPARGVVGYIGESGDSATPDYYLTQYALAPLVLDNSTDHGIVIGNFPSSHSPEIPQNLRLVQNFGNGILLLAGKETK
jgi:hypothetical protein